MRTTIDLPDPLFREVKSTAAARGQKLKDFIAESLRETLEASGGKTEEPDEILDQQKAVRSWLASAAASERNQTGPVGPLNREQLYGRHEP